MDLPSCPSGLKQHLDISAGTDSPSKATWGCRLVHCMESRWTSPAELHEVRKSPLNPLPPPLVPLKALRSRWHSFPLLNSMQPIAFLEKHQPQSQLSAGRVPLCCLCACVRPPGALCLLRLLRVRGAQGGTAGGVAGSPVPSWMGDGGKDKKSPSSINALCTLPAQCCGCLGEDVL